MVPDYKVSPLFSFFLWETCSRTFFRRVRLFPSLGLGAWNAFGASFRDFFKCVRWRLWGRPRRSPISSPPAKNPPHRFLVWSFSGADSPLQFSFQSPISKSRSLFQLWIKNFQNCFFKIGFEPFPSSVPTNQFPL